MNNDILIKVLEMLISQEQKPQQSEQSEQAFQQGDLVLVRAHLMGVQVGKVKSHVIGGKLSFSASRKLWRWKAKNGIALESLAIYGAEPSGTKATEITGDIAINDSDCIGIIRISRDIYDQIMGLATEEQS